MSGSYLRLTDELQTGVQTIDSQHAGFLDIYNGLIRVMAVHRSEAIRISPIIAEIVSYMDYHFFTEESLMKTMGYPGYAEHKKQHDSLAEALDELVSRLAEGTAKLDELAALLESWVTEHIATSDRQLGDYYRRARTARDRFQGTTRQRKAG